MTPDVSVLISVHNGAVTLRRCLDSILDQKQLKFEIILIDDGSTDDTLKICQEYASVYDNVIFHRNIKNIGLTKSLNVALKMAKGIYVARCDADDWYEKGKLFKQYTLLEESSKAEVCFTDFHKNPKSHSESFLSRTKVFYSKRLLRSLLCFNNIFVHGTMMVKRQALLDVGGYNEDFYYAQDYELYLRLHKKGEFIYVNSKYYHLSISESSISAKNRISQMAFKLAAVQIHSRRFCYYLALIISSYQVNLSILKLHNECQNILYNIDE